MTRQKQTTINLIGESIPQLAALVAALPPPPTGTDGRYKPSGAAVVRALIAEAHARMMEERR